MKQKKYKLHLFVCGGGKKGEIKRAISPVVSLCSMMTLSEKKKVYLLSAFLKLKSSEQLLKGN